MSSCRATNANPPYRNAMEHVQHALRLTDRVAFLLRLGFLSSQKRAAFWSEHKPSFVCVLSKRPSFTGGGTDNSDYAWIIWDGKAKKTELRWL